jgi:hypothetical protein
MFVINRAVMQPLILRPGLIDCPAQRASLLPSLLAAWSASYSNLNRERTKSCKHACRGPTGLSYEHRKVRVVLFDCRIFGENELSARIAEMAQ